MANTLCPFCETANHFEAVIQSVAHYQEPLLFIQCSACQKPVAVMDKYNVGGLLINYNNLLERVAEKIGVTS